MQALERKVSFTQQAIEDTKRKCITTQALRHDINTRLARAGDMLAALEQCTGDMDVSTPPVDLFSAVNQISLSQSGPGSMATSTNSTKTNMNAPMVSGTSAPASKTVVPLSGRFGAGRGKSRRSVQSFIHFAAISMDCTTISTEQPFSFGTQVQSFKNEQAEKQGAHAKDVCWFIQQPFELPSGKLLSMSSCLGSYTCTLGMLLYFVVNFMKATKFDQELRLYDEGLVEGIDGELRF